MSRKTTYNSTLRPSIWKEIYTHHKVHFDRITNKCTSLIIAYPQTIFAFMITSILISIGCFFLIPKDKTAQKLPSSALIGSMQTSMNGLVSTASVMSELLELNGLIQNIVKKDSLNHQDSIFLIHILDRMQILEKSIATQNDVPTINNK